MDTIFFLMVIGGMALLAASLPSIGSILHTLSDGALCTRWRFLHRLILAFLAGYAMFGALHWHQTIDLGEIVVAAILLAGGGFVIVVARLSAMTTRDIVRIAALERDVVRDPMTGVYNRRYLDSRLGEEIARTRRLKLSLCAMMVDLDHFKHVNDTYGHPVGDDVIRHVSTLLTRRVRTRDMVVRYGGEEFLVVAPGSSLADATCMGERILHDIGHQPLPLPDGGQLRVTASIGLAALADGEDQAGFLRRADEALYEAKRSGRNRIHVDDGGTASPPQSDRDDRLPVPIIAPALHSAAVALA